MIFLLLTACSTIVDFPPPDRWGTDSGIASTGSTAATDDETFFQPVAFAAACDAEGWSYRLRVDGWVGGATIDVLDGGGRHEHHAFGITASDPEGRWDELALGPLPVVAAPEQVPHTSTAFPCEAPLSMVVRIEDVEGVLLSCAVAGEDPSTALAEARSADPALAALGGCTVF